MQDIRSICQSLLQCNVAPPWTPYTLVQSCIEILLLRGEELFNVRLELGSELGNLLAGGLEHLSHVLADGRSINLLNLLVGIVGSVGLGHSLELLERGRVLALDVLGLVAATSDNFSVVGRTTTVPGKNLIRVSTG